MQLPVPSASRAADRRNVHQRVLIRRFHCLALAFTVLFSAAFASRGEDGVRDLSIGDSAPDFALPGIDGKTHRLADYKDGKVLMIFFTSNHCPTSHGAAARLKEFLSAFRNKGLTFVAINPNHPDGLSIDELGYSKYNDGFEDMKKYAADEGFDFPYLYDGDTQSTAKAYGCIATPHVFIFDAERKLRYKGRFDDSQYADPATVKSPDARNAVEALLAGRPVPVPITKPHGCSTKWRSKQTGIAQAKQKWDSTPVDVDTIDAAGMAALRKGGTKNVRLFNVWATYCGPCVAEFPELVATARKFDMRNFEFISISVDELKHLPKAKAFLEKNGAGLSERLKKSVKAEGRKSNSYIFAGTDMDDLMKELDPQWEGAIPHTVLVDTDGKILWRHNGEVDGDELRTKVLERLGTVYKP
jgi:peroxiredoxin